MEEVERSLRTEKPSDYGEEELEKRVGLGLGFGFRNPNYECGDEMPRETETSIPTPSEATDPRWRPTHGIIAGGGRGLHEKMKNKKKEKQTKEMKATIFIQQQEEATQQQLIWKGEGKRHVLRGGGRMSEGGRRGVGYGQWREQQRHSNGYSEGSGYGR